MPTSLSLLSGFPSLKIRARNRRAPAQRIQPAAHRAPRSPRCRTPGPSARATPPPRARRPPAHPARDCPRAWPTGNPGSPSASARPARAIVRVPEAAMHEHRRAPPREQHVRTPRQPARLHAEATSQRVQRPAQGHLRSRIPPLDPRHDLGAGERGLGLSSPRRALSPRRRRSAHREFVHRRASPRRAPRNASARDRRAGPPASATRGAIRPPRRGLR